MRVILNNNALKISDITLSAEGIISEVVVLRDIRPSYAKDGEGNRTDVIECIRYDCVDPNNYATFTIKVESTRAIMSKEDLEASEDAIYISIPVKETLIKPYKIEYGKAEVSIVAPYVKVTEN